MKDMKKEVKEYTDKKQMKEFNDMDKSCKNCKSFERCNIVFALEASDNCMDADFSLFWCQRHEPKKKTVKLYRYTYDYHGAIYQSEWTSDDDDLYFGNDTHKKLLKTEEKEIQI